MNDKRNTSSNSNHLAQIMAGQIIEASPSSMILVDAHADDMPIVYANAAFETLTGYASEEVIGRNCRFLQGDDQDQPDLDILRHAIENKQACTVTLRNYRKDGTLFWNELRVSPILDADGHLTHFVGVQNDVTEHTTEAPRGNATLYTQMLDHLPDVVVLYDADLRFLFINSEGQRRSGHSQSHFVGKTDEDVFPPEITQGYMPLLRKAQSTGEVQTTEVDFELPSMSYTSIVTYVPITNEQGEVENILGLTQDITKRKQAEEALHESEKQYRNLFENTMHEIHLWKLVRDEQGAIKTWQLVEANPAALKAWGKNRPDIIGKTTDEVFSYNATKQFMPIVKKIFSEGTPYTWEAYFPPTGEFLYMTSVPFGEYFISTGTDITERKRLEEALRRQHDELDHFFTVALDLFCIADTDGNFIKLNKAWERTLGYSIEQLEGQSFLHFVHPDDLQPTLNVIAQLDKQQEILNFVNRYRTANGEYRYIEWRSHPDGKLIYAAARDITERKQVEDTLRFQKQLLDAAGQAIIATDKAGEIIYWNHFAETLYGWTAQEAIGQNIVAIIPVETQQDKAKHIMHDVLGGNPWHGEFIARSKDGRTFPIFVSDVPLYDEDGEIISVIGISSDITERKQAEEALARNEYQLRWLVQNMPILIDAFDADKHIIVWNRECEQVTGYTADEIVGNPRALEMLYPDPDYRQYVFSDVLQFGNALHNREYTLTCKDGSQKIIRWSHIPAPYSVTGDTSWAIGIDVTEQRRAEEALRASEHQYRTLVENTPDAVQRLTREGVHLYVNPLFAELMGMNQADIIGKSNAEIGISSDLIAQLDAFRERVYTTRQTVDLDFNFEVAGEPHYFYARLVPEFDEQGEIVSLLGITRDITERKQLQEELRHSEARYRNIVNTQSELICRYRPDSTLVFVNDAYCQYFGKTADELLGTSFLDLIPPDARAAAQQHYLSTLDNPKLVYYEHPVIDKAGETRWQAWIDQVIFDDAGKLVEIQAVGRDITERKQLEDELRLSESRFRIISETISDYAYAVDVQADGTIDYEWVAGAFEQMTGYTAQEFKVRGGWISILHPEDSAIAMRRVERLLSGKEDISEFRIITRAGDIHWLQDYGQPIWDEEQGRVTHIYGAAQDITERKRIEGELQQINRRYDELVKNIPAMVYRVRLTPDLQYSFDYLSPRCKDFTGYDVDEVMENPDLLPTNFSSEEVAARHWELMVESMKTMTPYYFDGEVTIDGEQRWIRLQSRPQKLGNGDVIWDGLHLDITDQKLAQKRELELELERERRKLLTSFIQDAAHEFRTPLSAINSSSYLMSRSEDLKRRVEKAGRIEAHVRRITNLVDMLTLMAKLERSENLEMVAVNLQDMIHHIVQDMQAKFNTSHKLQWDIPPELPEIIGNAESLAEAFRQIIENACRFTPQGGAITVTAQTQNAHMRIEVQDTGQGIAENDLPRVFDTFWRQDTAHSTSGFGLGLPIAQKIIEQHGGEIMVESNVGRGTTVHIYLPIPHPRDDS